MNLSFTVLAPWQVCVGLLKKRNLKIALELDSAQLAALLYQLDEEVLRVFVHQTGDAISITVTGTEKIPIDKINRGTFHFLVTTQ